MSIATVVTRGYGSFGSVNKLPTQGFDIGETVGWTAITDDSSSVWTEVTDDSSSVWTAVTDAS